MKKQILFAAIALSAFTLSATAQGTKEVKTVKKVKTKTTKVTDKANQGAKPMVAEAKPVAVKHKVKATKTVETKKNETK